jgi:hypothetical protein
MTCVLLGWRTQPADTRQLSKTIAAVLRDFFDGNSRQINDLVELRDVARHANV